MAIVDAFENLQNVDILALDDIWWQMSDIVKCQRKKLTFALDICQRKCQGQTQVEMSLFQTLMKWSLKFYEGHQFSTEYKSDRRGSIPLWVRPSANTIFYFLTKGCSP